MIDARSNDYANIMFNKYKDNETCMNNYFSQPRLNVII